MSENRIPHVVGADQASIRAFNLTVAKAIQSRYAEYGLPGCHETRGLKTLLAAAYERAAAWPLQGSATSRSGMRVKVVVHDAEEGGFWAEVPGIPGCVTEGDTREELLENLRDAIEGCLLTGSGAFQTSEEGGREEEIVI